MEILPGELIVIRVFFEAMTQPLTSFQHEYRLQPKFFQVNIFVFKEN